mmetsp:Transcript_97164/g.245040  ORF Transcript_97164/g.245040 Transcript_97164/m.245040 type:complete len:1352 (-) Transcript_97164:253-4308(-)
MTTRKSLRKSRTSADASSDVLVEVAYAFGSHCGTGFTDAVAFADIGGQYLVHPVGRHVSFRHIGSGETSYVIESAQVQLVTACAISRNRSLVAVAERCASRPLSQITLYNLRVTSASPERQPTRTLQDLGLVGIVGALGFSADAESSLLVLASRAPELMLAVVDWRKNHVVGRCKLLDQVDRVALSPLEDGVVSASGSSSLRLWTLPDEKAAEDGGEGGSPLAAEGADEVDLPEDELVALPQPLGLAEASSMFTDHAWIDPADGSLVACTEEGPVHIILAKTGAEPDLLRTIAMPFIPSGEVPRSVCCFPGGFVLGGDSATLSLWEQQNLDPDDEIIDPQVAARALEHIRTAVVAPSQHAGAAVCCVDVVCPGEDHSDRIAIGLSDRSIGHMKLATLRRGGDSFEETQCELLSGGFHPGPIASIDLAVQRPIVASVCRQESAVRIWNYVAKRCELRWAFQGEDPTCVAVHPLGYLLAVGFMDKLRVMQVLVEELKPFREITARGIRQLRFSNGGHLLAVAQGKLVLVFSVRTMAKVATLRGHSQLVCSMCFAWDDRALTTCGEDGSIVEWNTYTWSKANEFLADRSAGGEARALAAGVAGQACVAVVEGSKSLVRFYKDCEPMPEEEMELPETVSLNSLIQFEGSGSAVFGASTTGSLWVRSETDTKMEAKDHGLHCGPCLDIRIASDGRTAISAGEDGTIFVLRLSGLSFEEHGRGPANSDVVMINRGEIQHREEEIQQLAAEAASLKVQIVEDSARMQTECIQRVAEARKQDQDEIRNLRTKIETLQQQATAQERESLRQMKAMEAAHVHSADQLESKYDSKILSEADRFRSMQAELRRLAELLIHHREESQRRVEAQRSRQQEELRNRIGDKDTEVKKLKELIAFSQHRFDTMLDQEAMEHNLERDEFVRKSEADLEQQKLVEYKLKKEQDTMLRGLDMMEKDRERAAKEQLETNSIVRNLTEEVEKLQKEVNAMKQERRDREATLRDKELEIGAFKVKVNTLKKFKHVLDFRLREVTLSLEPKDATITDLGSKLKELEEEFERQLDVHKQMEANLRDQDEQIKEKSVECSKLREVIKQQHREICQFTEDLRDLATNEQDVRKWPRGIRAIHRKHVKPERLSRDVGGPAMQELGRQIKVTEKKASTLASRTKSSEEDCKSDIRQRVDENFELIHELDKLRKDRKELNSAVKNLELKVQALEKRQASVATPAKAIRDSGQGLEDTASANMTALAEGATGSTDRLQGVFGPGATSQASPVPILSHDGSLGRLRKAGLAHRSPEERRQMQQLLAAADLRNQQVQMQRLEQKLLQDQLSSLMASRGQTTDVAPVAAGAGHAAVRMAAATAAT